MNIFNVIKNEINAAIGYQQTFEELIANGDITRAISMMEDHSVTAEQCIREYNADSHKIMKRQSKIIRDKDGNFIRTKDLNKIAVPYPLYINEIALVFLYGRPVKWNNATPDPDKDERIALDAERRGLEDGDPRIEEIDARLDEIRAKRDAVEDRYQKFISTLEKARFDAHIREAKRVAGIEESAAMLYHCYKDDDGEPRLLIKVLSKQKNDDIYTMFDQYDRLVAFAWGYNTVNEANQVMHHFDIYTAQKKWTCQQRSFGKWDVTEEPNIVGKIPVIIFMQHREWEQTTTMIDRVEKAQSQTADSNDRFSDPKLVATAEIVNQSKLPKEEDEGNLYVLKNGGDLKYLERNDNNEARSGEVKWLDDHILSKSFTPNLTMEALKGLGQASGRMLEQYLILAKVKADKRKETHDGYLSRTSNLVLAILDNVLDVANKGYSELQVTHEFSEPFGEDVQLILTDATKQFNAGGMSTETYLERSYLIKDPKLELDRIEKEKAEKMKQYQQQQQIDAFGVAE